MRRATPPLAQYVFMSLCLVKQSDNFTFSLTLYVKICEECILIHISYLHTSLPSCRSERDELPGKVSSLSLSQLHSQGGSLDEVQYL
jgi:hypothetical protein